MPFETDPGLKLEAVAQAIADRLSLVPDLVVLTYDPIGAEIENGTIVIGESSTVERTGLEEPEHQLGRDDYFVDWTCRLYLRLDDPATSWAEARRQMGRIIHAIDAEHTLGREVTEARVTSFEVSPEEPEEGKQHRKLVAEATVSTLFRMPR